MMENRQVMSTLTEHGFGFKDENFRWISSIVHADTGIHLTSSKASLVYSRLTKRLRKLRIPHFDAYCTFIDSSEGVDERNNMISALTTNVTSFYRENHHFEDLRTRLLPNLLKRAAAGGKVRIWSAACSSGEEPYSIAIEILRLAPEAARHDIKILATDIDPVILDKACAGEYTKAVVQKLSPDIQTRFFNKSSLESGSQKVTDAVKRLITFKRLNLVEPWPVAGPFDVIFCRNVTIYFDPPTRTKVWEKFAGVLAQNGQLYVGHSERISGAASKLLESNGVTGYRRSDI